MDTERLMPTLLLVLIGLTAGYTSGLFGIGGGIIIVPALMIFLGFTQHRALGTSLAILLPPVGLGAVMEYARHGEVDWKSAVVIALIFFASAWLGAFTANKLAGPVLRIMFGSFVVLMGCYMIWGALRVMHQAR